MTEQNKNPQKKWKTSAPVDATTKSAAKKATASTSTAKETSLKATTRSGRASRPTKSTGGNTTKKLKMPLKINGWKIATLVLLGLILGGAFYLKSLISADREAQYQEPKYETVDQEGVQVIAMETNKAKVNQLIDHYLQEYLTNDQIQYQFYLENQALLKGTFELLGYPMNFYLYFEPYVMDDGNVQLKAKSVSIGTLGIPVKEVLRYIRNSFDFPEWIEINLDEQTMVIHLDQFSLAAGLRIKADKINLVDDDIRFNLYLTDGTQQAKEQTNDTTTSSNK